MAARSLVSIAAHPRASLRTALAMRDRLLRDRCLVVRTGKRGDGPALETVVLLSGDVIQRVGAAAVPPAAVQARHAQDLEEALAELAVALTVLRTAIVSAVGGAVLLLQGALLLGELAPVLRGAIAEVPLAPLLDLALFVLLPHLLGLLLPAVLGVWLTRRARRYVGRLAGQLT